jgi:hypothetical protein
MLGLLRTFDNWWRFDFIVGGWLRYADGAAYDIKVRKNDQFRHGHQARVGVPEDKRFDLLAQTWEAMRLLGTQPSPLCDGSFNRGVSCQHCPPLFPRRIKKGTLYRHVCDDTDATLMSEWWHGGPVPCFLARLPQRTVLQWNFNSHGASRYTLSQQEARLWRRPGHSRSAAAATCRGTAPSAASSALRTLRALPTTGTGDGLVTTCAAVPRRTYCRPPPPLDAGGLCLIGPAAGPSCSGAGRH